MRLSRPLTPRNNPQKITAAATHNESAAFGATTKVIRVVCAVDTYVAFGTTPVATSANLYMVAGVPEFFGVDPSSKISVLRVGGSDGAVSIVEGDQI